MQESEQLISSITAGGDILQLDRSFFCKVGQHGQGQGQGQGVYYTACDFQHVTVFSCWARMIMLWQGRHSQGHH